MNVDWAQMLVGKTDKWKSFKGQLTRLQIQQVPIKVKGKMARQEIPVAQAEVSVPSFFKGDMPKQGRITTILSLKKSTRDMPSNYNCCALLH